MKIQTSSVLFAVVATLPMACSSQVSLGRNNHAVTGDSGTTPGAGGELDMGTITTGFAGTASSGTGGAPSNPPPLDGGGGVACGPAGNWSPLIDLTSGPGQVQKQGTPCSSVPIRADAHIAALHIVNDGPMLDTFVAIVPDVESVGQRVVLGMKRPVAAMLGQATSLVFFEPFPVVTGLRCVPPGPTLQLGGSHLVVPGTEEYVCTRETLTGSLGPTFIRMISESGTIEAVISAGDPTGPDGQETCDANADASEILMIGNGPGSFETRPRSVHLVAGQQIVIRAHLFNTSATMLSTETRADFY